MERKVDYYGFAENDYNYLKNSYERGEVSNAMTYIAQNICERYLKSLIEYTRKTDLCVNNEMRTHSLKKLKKFLDQNIPEFSCDWSKVLPADGYYFSARYPGEDAFYADKSDVDECWAAVCEVKQAVDRIRDLEYGSETEPDAKVKAAKETLQHMDCIVNTLP